MARTPFDPPYTSEDLPQLDALHQVAGLGYLWLTSKRRAEIALTASDPDIKIIPLSIYQNGVRRVIGEAVMKKDGYGSFKIDDEKVARDIVGISAGSFSIGFKHGD